MKTIKTIVLVLISSLSLGQEIESFEGFYNEKEVQSTIEFIDTDVILNITDCCAYRFEITQIFTAESGQVLFTDLKGSVFFINDSEIIYTGSNKNESIYLKFKLK